MDKSQLYFLKDTVYFEPLFNRWYAWPHLIAPAQGARHTVSTHLRLMNSFVKNHELHIIASKQLAGGEFLNCNEKQVDEIAKLIDATEERCHDLIELSSAIDDLDELLRGHTSGETIEPLYAKIPSKLKGYVELFMDLEHNPSYRLLESLLYKSVFYKKELQSVSFGVIDKVEERPFILSTPRLADENHLHVNLHYNSPILKALLSTRDTPLPMSEIDALFEQCRYEGGLDYKELFSTDNPRLRCEPSSEGVKIQYTGHAGFLIETPDVSVLIDPVIACSDARSRLHMTSYAELPLRIDFICLTHTHQDHTNLETLLQLRHKTDQILVPKNNGGSLCDPSLKLMLQQLDFKVTELDDLEEVGFVGGKITAIPFFGEHGDLNVRSKAAWMLEYAGKKLFFGADSSGLDMHMYRNVHRVVGDVDVLAIGMECVGAPYTWLYGALHSKKPSKNIKDSRRLNGADSEQAASMVEVFNPKQVYVYALGAEPCYKYFMGLEYDENSRQITESNKMVSLCLEKGLVAERLIGSKKIEIF